MSEREKAASEEDVLKHLKSLEMQGHWAAWDFVEAQDLSWRRLSKGQISDAALKFVINAQLQTLPTDDNLARWKYLRQPQRCPLVWVDEESGEERKCAVWNATIGHVLAGCEGAAGQKRTMWRHDSVLAVLLEHVERQLDKLNNGLIKFAEKKDMLRFT